MFIVAVDEIKDFDPIQKGILEKDWTRSFNESAEAMDIPAGIHGFYIGDNSFTLSVFPSIPDNTPSYCNVIDLLRMTIPYDISVVNNTNGRYDVQLEEKHELVVQNGDLFTPTTPRRG